MKHQTSYIVLFIIMYIEHFNIY